MDVLAYDATTPVAVFQVSPDPDPATQTDASQQEDLVSFGKLVISLCCEFWTAGQHPGQAIDHITRQYSPDVKNLVMLLISPPSPLKSVDDVIRIVGARILNELDASQT
jgi:PAB-dependent poly(A)-specific ribonuclease subunit 3